MALDNINRKKTKAGPPDMNKLAGGLLRKYKEIQPSGGKKSSWLLLSLILRAGVV